MCMEKNMGPADLDLHCFLLEVWNFEKTYGHSVLNLLGPMPR